jgi:ribonucleoside-diphosphate reductase alpha chain
MVVRGGATALRAEPEIISEVAADPISALGWTEPTRSIDGVAERRAEARMKGYVGEACPECANFTLVRNGTCLKCETCGSTTGCS